MSPMIDRLAELVRHLQHLYEIPRTTSFPQHHAVPRLPPQEGRASR